ncbi:hypothetical protein Rhe02_27490 [Rhizocola hellebori]|uniref:CBM2 domain-containing protein n=1 Tax=Rhizocola hellebori TaxID=1392758 RepID=A0A8J3Q7A2_9ACTN|nr:cellulose binding domain-containing protein [Rhizocola hellebori]GIH04682.1 hypothetical protein Rhe02_27490 [Rhizocola hellebori]
MARPAPLAALAATVAALIAALVYVVVSPTLPAQAAAVRIMPLGDSITGSPGCWRALLWNRLQNSGQTNIDFVGTLPPQGCGVAYDGDNEGHGGFLATNIANQNQLVGWLSGTRPDVVIMHLGTNDVWSNIAPATILAAFSRLVDQMRASNPAMRILVAKIIPMGTSQCTPCGQRVVDFNNAIPSWAAGKTTTQSPITVVDQWTGFNTTTDTTDGVHPNAAGDQKISDRWFSPLVSAIGGVPPTPPTAGPTSSPTVSPSPSPSTPNPIPPLRCRAVYQVVNQWQGGFQAEVTVTNITTATQMTSWSLSFNFANGQTITQIWSASYTQTGATVIARNVNYNGSLAPGASTKFGFLANWNGTNSVPTLSCA